MLYQHLFILFWYLALALHNICKYFQILFSSLTFSKMWQNLTLTKLDDPPCVFSFSRTHWNTRTHTLSPKTKTRKYRLQGIPGLKAFDAQHEHVHIGNGSSIKTKGENKPTKMSRSRSFPTNPRPRNPGNNTRRACGWNNDSLSLNTNVRCG